MPRSTFDRQPTAWASADMQARIRRRYRAERNFKALGLVAVAVAAGFLLFLLSTIVASGWTAFLQTQVKVPVTFSAERLGITADEARADPQRLARANFQGVLADAVEATHGDADLILSDGAWLSLRAKALADPDIIGTTIETWVITSSSIDQLAKGRIDLDADEADRPVSDLEVRLWRQVQADGALRTVFNTTF